MSTFFIKKLIWDNENRNHIQRHDIDATEVEEVCQNIDEVIISFRSRLLIKGNTINQRRLYVILSPQDEDGTSYQSGTYYPITAYESDN